MLRGVWGLGNAMFFATAMVVLVNLAVDREWVVGLFETALGLGFAVGPLIGGLLGEVSWRLPFFVCGVFMVLALGVAARKLREPTNRQAPVRVGQIFATYRRPAFIALCVVTAAYNFVFFVVLGYTPLFLHLDVVPLGLAFTGWGLGLAAGILVIGHRLAHRIGAVQTVGVAIAGLLVCMALFATSSSAPPSRWWCWCSPASAWAWPTPTSPTWRSASAPATGGWPPARSTWSAGVPPRPRRSSPASSPSTRWRCRSGSASGCSPSACWSTWPPRT